MTDYDVIVLAEQPLTAIDAGNLRGLHEEIEDPVAYHVLLPVEDAAGRVEGALGTMGTPSTGEVLAGPPTTLAPEDVRDLQEGAMSTGRAGVEASLAAIAQAGGRAVGEPVTGDPIDALTETVARTDAREVIIMTRPHVVAEFLHLDWTSKARRRLGVPVLHLLEHENFDEQAGEGEGISGF